MIHPTAIIHPRARLHPTVQVGAYSIIDEHVELGAGCEVLHHVHLTGHTSAGENNFFGVGCVIGAPPQDFKYKNALTKLRIGSNNVFREMVTIHCSNTEEEDTVVGSECFFMATSHVGHNAFIGDKVILANSALIAGHVTVGSQAFISGNTAIHQFVRIGELAMIQGVSAMSCDVPPYTIAFDKNLIAGLNIVGLRRAGFSVEERLELKRVYNFLFRTQLKRKDAVYQAKQLFHLPASQKMIEFVESSSRAMPADAESLHKASFKNERSSE
ncbi:MAG: acyl-ACP--UDP-N-acetylglucosamine O-acyltransferase [Verrucomicrobiota bacterium]|nr:acyl-ACP--UDP-N-acetylglucosamine O-acyltransferase [Verrucomicrobiota bacterium]